MGVEADEPQVQALASALGLRVRVEYLNAQSVPWSERCGPHRHVVCGAAADGGGARAKSRPLPRCLLARPASRQASSSCAIREDHRISVVLIYNPR